MAKIADTYLIYQVLKRLTTPFQDTEAFELGIIDKNGKLLKSPKTTKEKEAYSYFDRFIFNLKRILHKFGLKSKFANYGAALFLLKEDRDYIPSELDCYNGIIEEMNYLKENTDTSIDSIREDIANVTGAGVVGTGDNPVHWRSRGVRSGMKGRKNKVGRSISALNFIKQRNKLMANTAVKSSYPAGAFKVEETNPRIPRKSGQPAKSDKHSDLYTDEDPKGTIHGLKFATVQDAKDSVNKIEKSGRSHAHKIQAAVAMEQRAKVMGKSGAAAVYRMFINKMKKKTNENIDEKMMQKDVNDLEKFADRILKKYKVDVEFTKHFVDRLNDKRNSPEIKVAELQRFFKKIQRNKAQNIIDNPDTEIVLKDMSTNLNLPVKIVTKGNSFEVTNKTIMRKDNFSSPNKIIKYEEFNESLWANIHKKKQRIKQGSGEKMRKVGDKGAPTRAQMKRAQNASEEAPTIGGIKMKKLGKGKPGGYKSLVTRHLGAKAAEKIDKADGSKLVAKGKKTGNTDLIRKGNFIKNVIGRK